MRPTLKISYWSRSDEDFAEVNQLAAELYRSCEVSVTRNVSDEAGGGLFQLLIEIANDLSIQDFIKSYVEDAAKIGIAFVIREIFRVVKRFVDKARSEWRRPGIDEIRIIFKDLQIFVYSIYEDSIDDVEDELVSELFARYFSIANAISSPIDSIHIPIFDHTERVEAYTTGPGAHGAFEIRAFRAPLSVDETIRDFRRENYFALWGIRTHDDDFVYSFKGSKLVQQKFYTETEYWSLWSRMYEAAKARFETSGDNV